jgi:hypothetical protein
MFEHPSISAFTQQHAQFPSTRVQSAMGGGRAVRSLEYHLRAATKNAEAGCVALLTNRGDSLPTIRPTKKASPELWPSKSHRRKHILGICTSGMQLTDWQNKSLTGPSACPSASLERGGLTTAAAPRTGTFCGIQSRAVGARDETAMLSCRALRRFPNSGIRGRERLSKRLCQALVQ